MVGRKRGKTKMRRNIKRINYVALKHIFAISISIIKHIMSTNVNNIKKNMVLPFTEVNLNNLQFAAPVKNTFSSLNVFARVLYSTPLFTVKGLFVRLGIHYDYCVKIFDNYRCFLRVTGENEKRIHAFEEGLLHRYTLKNKKPVYKLAEQLKLGSINVVSEKVLHKNEMQTGAELVLKIYGVWENDTEYGLTYTFDIFNHP
jgi:hypothetical protein